MFCYKVSAPTTQFHLWNGVQLVNLMAFRCGLEVQCSNENPTVLVSNSLLTTEICWGETYSNKKWLQRTSEKELLRLKTLKMATKEFQKTQVSISQQPGIKFGKKCQRLVLTLFWLFEGLGILLRSLQENCTLFKEVSTKASIRAMHTGYFLHWHNST